MEIIFIGLIIWGIYAAIKSNSDSNQNEYHQQPDAKLKVSCRKYWGENPFDPDGDNVELLNIAMMGTVNVPYDNYPITRHLYLQDVTNGNNNAKLLACTINVLGDSDGMFRYSDEYGIPYVNSYWDSPVDVITIPLYMLKAPYRGSRQLSALVMITDRGNGKNCYSQGNEFILFEQKSHGYLEIEQELKRLMPRMVELAICIAAADGHIDPVEKEKIKETAKELSFDDDESKVAINDAMKRTIEAINSRRRQPLDIINEICDELIAFDAEELSQMAYMQCVDMVIADDIVEKSEEQVLKHIARRLNLSDEFVRETHEENIRSSMHSHKSIENILGIPDGLSYREEITWVNMEYDKWRPRVTSKNAEYAKEASERLTMLAKLRTELNRKKPL
ncbi:MAG: TerB family tellurite resistance protein [Kiritimatiellae bacterium]|nr:TerB family tellurite resistance protein [Kiritimatiellia bacterium]